MLQYGGPEGPRRVYLYNTSGWSEISAREHEVQRVQPRVRRPARYNLSMGFGQRIALAFRAFWHLLRAGDLPADIVAAAAVEPVRADDGSAEVVRAPAAPERPDDGAVLLLSVLQREGRLVDFLMEDLGTYSDVQIGAAVRDVHANCRRALAGAFELEPILEGAEEQAITIPTGFDPASIKLVGRVVGTGPFRGVLRHRGWRSSRVQLPVLGAPDARQIVAPAEVEIS